MEQNDTLTLVFNFFSRSKIKNASGYTRIIHINNLEEVQKLFLKNSWFREDQLYLQRGII